MKIKTRIAPTPSGFLHIGNAFSFAITWALAKQNRADLALRIDDLDNTRFRIDYLEDIFSTLRWMGLDYTEGPASASDFFENHSQQLRLPAYENLLDNLVKKDLVYACDCSRSKIAQLSTDGSYPRICLNKNIPLDQPEVAWRIKIDQDQKIVFKDILLGEVEIELGLAMPDFVIKRKDGIPSYQIGSLCDDKNMCCNLIVRGKDLINSTAAQIFLDQAVGSDNFSKSHFVHHPLIIDPSGSKLSKSQDAFAIKAWIDAGASPQKIWESLFHILKWEKTTTPTKELFLERFSLSQLRVLND